MMNKNAIWLSMAFLMMSSCAKETSKTDREIDGLKGRVKSVFSISYNAIDRFGEGVYVKTTPQFFGSHYTNYDSIGNKLDYKMYMINSCKKDYESYYDHNNRRVKWMFFDDDDDTKMRYGTEYKYNEKGQLSVARDLLENDVSYLKYEYNDKNQLVYYKDENGDETRYEYDDKGKVVKSIFNTFYNHIWNCDYKYDENGNLKSEVRKIKDGRDIDIRCFFYKYDEKDRVIDLMVTDGEDSNNSKILRRQKSYYANALVSKPFRIKEWGENGELKSEEYSIWFVSINDTLSIATLDKNYNIFSVKSVSKTAGGKVFTEYNIDSKIFIKRKYNYTNGKLASISDEDGNNFTYEYDGDELVKEIRPLSEGKVIVLYKDNREISSNTYDKHNKIENTIEFSYEGNDVNGIITQKMTHKDKEPIVYVTHLQNSKKVKEVVTENGVATTTDFVYNEQGDINSEKSTNGRSKQYEYKYDAFNNWIQQICFSDEKIDCINERAITYF